ncbi:MAG: prepilin-type N-terminal cleavage/methylation domain-containing protein [Phycisphaerales bacterium]|nr:prepilin-type N-terminal cleavage/methylation domain-containing protein [Phycisphaerales bacterium]
MNAQMRQQIKTRASVRAGFTLVEMLIAVAAVALLTVGIVQIFRVTTKTVATGRRVSNVLTYANLLERQLRDDISKMSRRGFLVIRNELADGTGAGVRRFQGDTVVRARRVDELQFFAEGRFVSARNPVNPSLVATAPAARIWWGHGLKGDPQQALTQPQAGGVNSLRDPNNTTYFGEPGVNEFASNWTLARHVTLLAPPSNTTKLVAVPNTDPVQYRAENANERDSIGQIAQQPAAPSIFKAVNEQTTLRNVQTLRGSELNGEAPEFSSGLIDIAAMDLATVRSFINDAPDYNQLSNNLPFRSDTVLALGGADNAALQQLSRMWTAMVDSLPAASDARRRMRVEDSAPNPLGIGANAGTDAEREALRADQHMLASHGIVPHCTEFIVEWSYGEQVPPDSGASTFVPAGEVGRVKWFGLPRATAAQVSSGASSIVEPYPDYAFRTGVQSALFFNTRTAVVDPNTGALLSARYFPFYQMSQPPTNDPRVQYSFFGFNDPLWPPADVLKATPNTQPTNPVTNYYLPTTGGLWSIDFVDTASIFSQFEGANLTAGVQVNKVPLLARDVNFNGAYEPQLGEVLNVPETLPWKWPKLLRVTVTIADPIDPSFERTFQFIYDLPSEPSAQRF